MTQQKLQNLAIMRKGNLGEQHVSWFPPHKKPTCMVGFLFDPIDIGVSTTKKW